MPWAVPRAGVSGIKLSDKDELAGVAMVRPGEQLLVVSEFGYGKRTEYDNFAPHGRGTRGQVVYRASEKTGEVVAALSVGENDDLVCITSQGNTLKLRLADIAVLGKTAMGVHIVNITRPDLVVGVARVMKEDEDGVREAEEAARADEARAAAGAGDAADTAGGLDETVEDDAGEGEDDAESDAADADDADADEDT